MMKIQSAIDTRAGEDLYYAAFGALPHVTARQYWTAYPELVATTDDGQRPVIHRYTTLDRQWCGVVEPSGLRSEYFWEHVVAFRSGLLTRAL
jgi:hypothetical protein